MTNRPNLFLAALIAIVAVTSTPPAHADNVNGAGALLVHIR